MLANHTEYSFEEDPNVNIVHQFYNFPFPIQNRDFVMKRTFSWNEIEKSLHGDYFSMEDPRIPLNPEVVRGHSAFTWWDFKVVANNNNNDNGSIDSKKDAGEDLVEVSINGLIDQHQKKKKNSSFTRIEVATVVDLRGSIPAWLVNQLQKRWPSMTINKLTSLAALHDTTPVVRVMDW